GRTRPAARPPRFSFHPGLPDLAAFPHQAWSRALRQALRSAPAGALAYGDPRGRPELRAALADYLGRARGVIADPELVVVGAGLRHGLALLAQVLARSGVERIALEDPCLEPHRDVVRAAGIGVSSLPVDARGARTEGLRRSGAGAAVVSPAHQYPTGVV